MNKRPRRFTADVERIEVREEDFYEMFNSREIKRDVDYHVDKKIKVENEEKPFVREYVDLYKNIERVVVRDLEDGVSIYTDELKDIIYYRRKVVDKYVDLALDRFTHGEKVDNLVINAHTHHHFYKELELSVTSRRKIRKEDWEFAHLRKVYKTK